MNDTGKKQHEDTHPDFIPFLDLFMLAVLIFSLAYAQKMRTQASENEKRIITHQATAERLADEKKRNEALAGDLAEAKKSLERAKKKLNALSDKEGTFNTAEIALKKIGRRIDDMAKAGKIDHETAEKLKESLNGTGEELQIDIFLTVVKKGMTYRGGRCCWFNNGEWSVQNGNIGEFIDSKSLTSKKIKFRIYHQYDILSDSAGPEEDDINALKRELEDHFKNIDVKCTVEDLPIHQIFIDKNMTYFVNGDEITGGAHGLEEEIRQKGERDEGDGYYSLNDFRFYIIDSSGQGKAFDVRAMLEKSPYKTSADRVIIIRHNGAL